MVKADDLPSVDSHSAFEGKVIESQRAGFTESLIFCYNTYGNHWMMDLSLILCRGVYKSFKFSLFANRMI